MSAVGITSSCYRELSLSDLTSSTGIFCDGDWVESKDQDPNGDVRLIQLADIGDGEYLKKSARFLTSEKARELRCTYLIPGDILIARMPDPIARCCIFPGDPRPCVTVVDVCIVRPNPLTVDARWLMHAINSPDFRLRITKYLNGTTRQRISRRNLDQIKLQVPPLPMQQRIAAILDKADALRRKRREALAKLDTLLHSVFSHSFTGAKREFEIVPFPDVVHFQEGPGVRNWQFRNEGIKLVNVGNIVFGELTTSNTSRYLDPSEVAKRYKHFLLDEGDYVLASSGVTWGKIAEVKKEHLPLCLNTSMIRIRPKSYSVLDRTFLRAFIEVGGFRQQIDRLITGSAQPNFGPAHLKQVTMPLPPIERQREFAVHTQSIRKEISSHIASKECLDRLFAVLQHSAFLPGEYAAS